MKKFDLSIVIVNYNTKKITQDCLESIFRSPAYKKLKIQIVMVDNDSHDGSPEMLKGYEKRLGEKFVLILSEENLGFGKGNNLGVKHAQSDYVLLLNTDTVILNDALGKLYTFYKQNDYIHFLGAKLFNKDMTSQPSAARFFSLPVVFGALFLRGDYWGLTRFSPDTLAKTDWISGACILTKKKYYEALGGFDRDIFMYMEEVDLLYRARQKGWSTYVYPEAKIIHLGSASSGGKTFPILQVYKGFLYFYTKHRSKLALFWLKFMLKLKALIAVAIGRLTNNRYLIETYEQAYQLAKTG